jgi:predicted metal-dependent phosphoesterase TrpH
MFNVDLHTHSTASPDGGMSQAHYERALSSGLLDCIAVTDHNRIDMAVQLQRALGESRIIVGEEIMTTAGEIIGLYLEKPVLAGLTPLATVQAIKAQGGFVYIPHPFETVRRGLGRQALEEIADYIDIVEVHNGRAWLQNRGPRAAAWAKLHGKLRAASSDAHGNRGLGSGITQLEELPTRETFLELTGKAHLLTKRPAIRTLLYPKLHRLKRKLKVG